MRKNSCLFTLVVIVLGCFISLVPAKKYDLEIVGIECLAENESNGDEMDIRFIEDGDNFHTIKWGNVRKGQYYNYAHHFSFDHSLKIRMTEIDASSWIDPDDYIGEIVINSYDSLAKEQGEAAGDDARYKVTWNNLTPKFDEYKKGKNTYERRKPQRSQAENQLSSSDEEDAKQAFKELDSYLATDNRMHYTYYAAKHVYTVYKNTDDPDQRRAAIQNLKNALGYHLNPFRGIMENINKKEWPTLIIYGPTPSFNLLALSANAVYGIAIQLDGEDAAVIFELDGSLGLTAGHEGKIGFGINRNNVKGVAGWTWGFSIPADAEIVGGITFSYDLELFSWNLQEITYTWGPLPASLDVGLAHTWLLPP